MDRSKQELHAAASGWPNIISFCALKKSLEMCVMLVKLSDLHKEGQILVDIVFDGNKAPTAITPTYRDSSANMMFVY